MKLTKSKLKQLVKEVLNEYEMGDEEFEDAKRKGDKGVLPTWLTGGESKEDDEERALGLARQHAALEEDLNEDEVGELEEGKRGMKKLFETWRRFEAVTEGYIDRMPPLEPIFPKSCKHNAAMNTEEAQGIACNFIRDYGDNETSWTPEQKAAYCIKSLTPGLKPPGWTLVTSEDLEFTVWLDCPGMP